MKKLTWLLVFLFLCSGCTMMYVSKVPLPKIKDQKKFDLEGYWMAVPKGDDEGIACFFESTYNSSLNHYDMKVLNIHDDGDKWMEIIGTSHFSKVNGNTFINIPIAGVGKQDGYIILEISKFRNDDKKVTAQVNLELIKSDLFKYKEGGKDKFIQFDTPEAFESFLKLNKNNMKTIGGKVTLFKLSSLPTVPNKKTVYIK